LRPAEHLRNDRRGGHFDQHHVIESHPIEAVLERNDTLYFVGLDHAGQHVAHDERFPAGGDCIARCPVGSGQYAAQVVGRVTPLGGKPGVVEVEPADHGAQVERGADGIELIGRAGDLRAIWNDGARHDGPQ
jgi:hypothetical protein